MLLFGSAEELEILVERALRVFKVPAEELSSARG